MPCQPASFLAISDLAPVQVHLAERAGDDHGLGAARLGVGEDAADEVVDDALLGERQRGAAAVGLVVPVHGLAAEGLDDLVHVRRVLGVVGRA